MVKYSAKIRTDGTFSSSCPHLWGKIISQCVFLCRPGFGGRLQDGAQTSTWRQGAEDSTVELSLRGCGQLTAEPASTWPQALQPSCCWTSFPLATMETSYLTLSQVSLRSQDLAAGLVGHTWVTCPHYGPAGEERKYLLHPIPWLQSRAASHCLGFPEIGKMFGVGVVNMRTIFWS